MGNIDSERDFISVEDVVEAYLAMIRGESWGEIFNICSGVPYSIREIINVLLSQSPRTIRFEVDPTLVRESEIPVIYGSWRKASRAFGFRPTAPLAAALASAWQYEIGHSI